MSFPARWSGTHALVRLIMASLILCWVSVIPIDAQLYVDDYVYGLCNTASSSSNSTSEKNLEISRALLNELSQYTQSNLHYSISTSIDFSTTAYAMYQCRGDLSFSDCSACVSAITSFSACPLSIGIRLQFRGCYFRIEEYPFTDMTPDYRPSSLTHSNCSSSQDSNSLYQEHVDNALNSSATDAAANLNDFFNALVNSGSNSSKVAYAIAQCLEYSVNSSTCASCLSQGLLERNQVCNNSVSGELYYADCYYLFSNTPLTLLLQKLSPAPFYPVLPPPPSGVKVKNRTTPIIVGSLLGFFLLLSTSCAIWVYRRRKRSNAKHKIFKLETLQQGRATKFSFKDLRKATNNFDDINKLGEGGFGPVYKGKLKCGREVAIKMLSSGSRQGTREFMNEVELITNVQHRNLIQLLGCCVKGAKRLLVYEYLPHGSLDFLLFGTMEMNNPSIATLDWPTRFEIIIGIARGLGYLHEDSHLRIVHRDIKASNILLDNSMNPKIADFGLAKLFDDDNVTHVTTRVAGTIGYLAPEYAMHGQLTEKADVYSFGLVALEIVSGRRVIDYKLPLEKQHLLEWAWELYEKHQHLLLLDSKISSTTLENVLGHEVMKVVHVALLCTQTRAQSRPFMSQACTMLCGQTEILEQPKKPTFITLNTSPQSATITFQGLPKPPSSNRCTSSEIDPR